MGSFFRKVYKSDDENRDFFVNKNQIPWLGAPDIRDQCNSYTLHATPAEVYLVNIVHSYYNSTENNILTILRNFQRFQWYIRL